LQRYCGVSVPLSSYDRLFPLDWYCHPLSYCSKHCHNSRWNGVLMCRYHQPSPQTSSVRYLDTLEQLPTIAAKLCQCICSYPRLSSCSYLCQPLRYRSIVYCNVRRAIVTVCSYHQLHSRHGSCEPPGYRSMAFYTVSKAMSLYARTISSIPDYNPVSH
jgi:hypothetical protein